MVEISWTNEAEERLKEIYDYISLDNKNAAIKVITGIYEKTQILCDHPEIGYQYYTDDLKNIRILLYGHYRIVYLIKGNNNIDILGVFHGSMEIDKYLL